MYFGVVGESKRKVISLLLADYYKTASILYDFSFIDSKIIEVYELPLMLQGNNANIPSKEFYEVNSLVDTMINVQRFSQKTRKIDTQIKLRSTFLLLDMAVFGVKHGGKYFKLIFEKYPAISKMYYFILNAREDFLALDEISDVINIKDRVRQITDIVDEDSFDEFLAEFDIVSTLNIAKRISDKLLQEINEDEITFTNMEHSGIIDSNKSLLHLMSYIEKSSTTNGAISTFSHYIYINKYYNELFKKNKNNILNISEINNKATLDKLFHLNTTSKRLDKYIEFLAREELTEDIKESGNEILKIIASNSDALSEDSNDSVFAIFMILEIQKQIKSSKEKIKLELKTILNKNIPFEYRLAELELYIKMLISKQLDNKKVVSNSDELLDGFYSGVASEFVNLLNEVFNEYDTEERKTIDKGKRDE